MHVGQALVGVLVGVGVTSAVSLTVGVGVGIAVSLTVGVGVDAAEFVGVGVCVTVVVGVGVTSNSVSVCILSDVVPVYVDTIFEKVLTPFKVL